MADVALEVRIVDEVEAYGGGEQTQVGFGEPRTYEETAVGEVRVDALQRLEELPHGVVIGGLLRREARPVHAVVHRAVDLVVDGVYLRGEVGGIEIDRRISPFVELPVQHPDDVRRFVVD